MIPTTDLSRIDPDEGARACEEVGFLTVAGHGVPDALVADVGARSRAFFDLPDAEKEHYRAPAETPSSPRPERSSRTLAS